MKISVICVYNDEKAFENQLKNSLQKQNVEYELIAINNTKKSFFSASEALNFAVKKSTGNILIFSHQDIFLKTSKELEKFAIQIQKNEIGTIIGTQGVKEKSKTYYSNITAGEKYSNKIIKEYSHNLYEVSCVDEGFFGMKRETFDLHPFDEQLCNNWHLYCVEQCLNARKNNHCVYVYPIQLHHFSYGTITLSYMNNLKSLCYRYRKYFKYIWTTCYKVRTNKIYINLLVFLWIVNRKIKRRKLN